MRRNWISAPPNRIAAANSTSSAERSWLARARHTVNSDASLQPDIAVTAAIQLSRVRSRAAKSADNRNGSRDNAGNTPK
jgi:hypothetical protein